MFWIRVDIILANLQIRPSSLWVFACDYNSLEMYHFVFLLYLSQICIHFNPRIGKAFLFSDDTHFHGFKGDLKGEGLFFDLNLTSFQLIPL